MCKSPDSTYQGFLFISEVSMRRISLFLPAFLVIFMTAACAGTAPSSTSADGSNFGKWLEAFKQEAEKQGIARTTLDEAFEGVEPIPRIIELDRKQPESTITLAQYLERILNENREILEKVSSEYGVQPEYIVALWGIETNYGVNTGGYRTVTALATLAYDGRRSDFFRSELLKVLHISEDDHIPPGEIKGSWAGAMGQCQFMPSSFFNFAVDYNGDGRRDIWNTQEDVFASIANYLSKSGWQSGMSWGFKVELPKGFDKTLADIKQSRSLEEWKKHGLRPADGEEWPSEPKQAFLIFAGEGKDAQPLLVSQNYKVILLWNRSRYFATAVGMLAENIQRNTNP
jgi:membrane-bound lytic murein transglycosylase B